MPLCRALFRLKAYTLINGGGIDDLAVQLVDLKNRHINAYCVQHCGNWFVYNPEFECYGFKKKYQGAKVWTSLSYEKIKTVLQAQALVKNYTPSRRLILKIFHR